MKAAVWTGIDKIEVKEVPMPVVSQGEALIKVRCAGVCATDYHVISGFLQIGQPPNIQGHEICGEIVEINGKSDLKIGQRCVIATSIGCGECEACKQNKQYLCDKSSEIGYYPHNGGYAEYLKVPISAIVPIPDEVSDYSGAILESVVCPTEALMNLGVPKGGSVFVLGAGPAALSFIQISKLMGVEKIIALVRREDTAKRVLEFGATDVINSKDYPDVESRLLEINGGKKADMVIESTGSREIAELSMNLVKKGGKLVLYGICADDEPFRVNVKKLVTEEISIHGVVGNTKAWYPLVEYIAQGKLNIEKMVTHKFKIDDIDKAFDLYRNHDKKLIKAVIEF